MAIYRSRNATDRGWFRRLQHRAKKGPPLAGGLQNADRNRPIEGFYWPAGSQALMLMPQLSEGPAASAAAGPLVPRPTGPPTVPAVPLGAPLLPNAPAVPLGPAAAPP